jgi:hypothetical protein
MSAKRIRRGIAGISLGLVTFGGGLVLAGLPAANAAQPIYVCTRGSVTFTEPPNIANMINREFPGTCVRQPKA